MQSRALLVALALLVPAASLSLSATSQARLFLRRHADRQPQPDELAELKGANPEAYAIVKALLTKRSLGLLDPRHPTAKFSGAAPVAAQQEAPEEQGPEVYQQFASPAHAPLAAVATQSKVDVPYAEVQGHSHKDWLNWKPSDTAMSDEQMVQNVLGAVAELKGKKSGLLAKSRNTEENSLTAEAASMTTEPEVAAPQKPQPVEEPKPAAPAAPQAAAPRENSYLKNIDLGVSSQEASSQPAAPAPRKNSYLDGIDLSGDMPTVTKATESAKKTTSQMEKSSTNNYLSSFSWDDSRSEEQEHPQPKAPAREELPKATGQSSTLLAWLGVVNKAPQPQAAAPVAPAKPSNPYLADLS